MNLLLGTISFRHHLISIEQIAEFASNEGFSGIELWGVHARNLASSPEYGSGFLRERNLAVPMVSDYLPLAGERKIALEKAEQLCTFARHWGAKKVRTFAGDKPSSAVSNEERKSWVARLRELCDVASDSGVSLVVETHPNTLADTPASTRQLLGELDHSALRLNFDVIHVWEAGAEPLAIFRELSPYVAHMHLKNITARELLPVFAPANVYAPSGSRVGMANLFDGAFDFKGFLGSVMSESPRSWEGLDVTLEWFGGDVLSTFIRDKNELFALEAKNLGEARPRSGVGEGKRR